MLMQPDYASPDRYHYRAPSVLLLPHAGSYDTVIPYRQQRIQPDLSAYAKNLTLPRPTYNIEIVLNQVLPMHQTAYPDRRNREPRRNTDLAAQRLLDRLTQSQMSCIKMQIIK